MLLQQRLRRRRRRRVHSTSPTCSCLSVFRCSQIGFAIVFSLRFLSSWYYCTSMLCRHCKWPPIIIILWMTQEAIWSQLCNCTLFTITIFSFVRIFIIIFPFGWCINLESNFIFFTTPIEATKPHQTERDIVGENGEKFERVEKLSSLLLVRPFLLNHWDSMFGAWYEDSFCYK